MEPVLVLGLSLGVIAAAAGVALFIVLRRRKAKKLEESLAAFRPRYRQERPLSATEQQLYWRLVEALPECVILSQVAFNRFMRPDTYGKTPALEYRLLQERIESKAIDFLVCLKDFTVVAAIEMEGSANRPRDMDWRRDEVLRVAGVAVLRMPSGELPTVETLRKVFTSDEPAAKAIRKA